VLCHLSTVPRPSAAFAAPTSAVGDDADS
jgi:hypothetical protein